MEHYKTHFYVVLLCVAVAVLFYSVGKRNCPRQKVEYRYLPKNFEEEEAETSATDTLKGFL